MTPPLTGFFMKAAGLGKIHKEIEKQKREGGGAGNNRPRQRTLSVGHLGQYQVTRAPSRSVRNNQRLPNGPVRDTGGPTPFPRVHLEDVSREALDEYGLAWDWDPDNDNYIVIKKHLTRQELKELIQHAAWLRERKERELALHESELEAEQVPKLRESNKRSDAGWENERRRERDAERVSTHGDRVHDRRHAHVPQSRLHAHVAQAQNNQLPAPREVSTARPMEEIPLPSHPRSQRSRAPSMSSRLNQPFSPPGYTSMERPSQPPPQAHGLRSRNGISQPSAELPPIPPRHARESYNPRPRAPSVLQGSTPFARTPSIGPANRRFSHMLAASEDVRFASPPHRSESLAGARIGNNDPRPSSLSVRQGSTPFARAPNIGPTSRRFNHMPEPSEDVHFASPPHRPESLAGARNRNERPRQAAENARQFPLHRASGPGHPRSPEVVRGLESRRAYAPTPGSRAEGRDGIGRRNSGRGYRATL